MINDNFINLMQFQIERASSYFKGAENLIPLLHKDAKYTTLLMGGVYLKVLEKIEKNGYDVFTKHTKVSKTEKLKLIFKLKVKPSFFII